MDNGATQGDRKATNEETTFQPNPIRQQNFCPRFEYNDGKKIEIPAHMQRPLTLQEEIQRFVVGTLSHVMDQRGEGTFEEEDDFEDDEPDNLMSGYEVIEMYDDLGEPLGEDPPPRVSAATSEDGPSEGNDPPPDQPPAEPKPA